MSKNDKYWQWFKSFPKLLKGFKSFWKWSKDHPQEMIGIIGTITALPAGITAWIAFFPASQFTLYENADYGIKIKHPDDWYVQENNSSFTQDTQFIEVKFISTNEIQSNTCPTEMIVNVDDLGNQFFSIEGYKNLAASKIKQNNQSSKINDESNHATTLSNRRAYKLTYHKQDEQCSFRVMEIGTFWKNKAYYIVYIAKDNKYSQFLSTAEKMIKSFKFTDKN